MKDYARRDTAGQPPRRGRGQAAPPANPGDSAGRRTLPSFVTGVLVGLLIAFLVDLGLPALDLAGPAASSPAAVTEPGRVPVEEAVAAPPRPRFEFHHMFTEPDPLVPVVEEAGATAANPPPTLHYLLQAGSFRDPGDAEGLRAGLLLSGLDVQVHSVDLGNGDTWHRVMVGPFDNTRDLRRAQTRLREQDIDAIPLQRRVDGT